MAGKTVVITIKVDATSDHEINDISLGRTLDFLDEDVPGVIDSWIESIEEED